MDMLEYCRWRGDISLKADGFNEVDNLLLSQLAYVEFAELLSEDTRITIRELSERYHERYSEEEIRKMNAFTRNSPLVLKALAESKRFGDCILYNYVSKLHHSNAEQFAAMMVDLPDRTTAVVFRGTDESLTGWKEDLMLSYRSIAAQSDALDYVRRHCSILRRYRLMGHSKGGNLALYAAVNSSWFLKNCIMQVISDDGPGLMPGTYREKDYDRIRKIYTQIVPEKDGVGTIYEAGEHRMTVRCKPVNIIAAHNMINWNVDGNRLVRTDEESYETNLMRKVFRQFLRETLPAQREVFVREFFENLDEANIKTILQISNGGLPLVIKALWSISDMNSEAKGVASKMLKTLSDNIGSDLVESMRKKATEVKKKTGENISELINEHGPKILKRNRDDFVES